MKTFIEHLRLRKTKNAHDILRITCPKYESIWKYFHAKVIPKPEKENTG